MRSIILFAFLPGCILQTSGGGGSSFPQGKEAEAGVISGVVIDAQTRQPVAGALVSTYPATGTAVSNSQGRFVLETPPLTHAAPVSVRADSPGRRQRETSCVSVAPGGSTSADVQLLDNDATPCASSCTDGNICLGGVCASACHPVCACNEKCQEGRCVIDAARPQPGSQCPSHSSLASDSISCVCDEGYRLDESGACTLPGSTCPEHSYPSGYQDCQCDEGYIQTYNSCAPAPFYGHWFGSARLTVDNAGQRDVVDLTFELDAFDVRQVGDTYLEARFSNGYVTSLSGAGLSLGYAGSNINDSCDAGEPQNGTAAMNPLTSVGFFPVIGLKICASQNGSHAMRAFDFKGHFTLDASGPHIVLNRDTNWSPWIPNFRVIETNGTIDIVR